jgi:hypothetical protein
VTTLHVPLGRTGPAGASALPSPPEDAPAITNTVWLGAPPTGGLALPDAQATPSHLYAPRGVWCDGERCIAVDSGNHRVLVWNRVPTESHAPADLVLGQPDLHTEGPRAGGRGVRGGLHLPTGVSIAEGRLIIADAWHHRVLVWDGVPDRSDVRPAWAIGQRTLDDAEPQAGANAPHGLGLYWPYGVSYIDGWLWVADTGNRRVLGWQGVPSPERAPDVVLGQPDASSNLENRGGAASAQSYRWPHATARYRDTLLVADAGNHRIFGYTPQPTGDVPASLVLGQRDFTTARETPHVPQGPAALRFPYALAADDERVIVSDTANNRVLLWRDVPSDGAGQPAVAVLGQDNFDSAGENRWLSITNDSLCWPYGLMLDGNTLAIADSGNNRVLLHTLGGAWRRSTPPDGDRPVAHAAAVTHHT